MVQSKPTEIEAVRDHAKLVYWYARKYSSRDHEYEDLVQEGFLGLIEAVRTYDPVNHPTAKFASYAGLYIARNVKACVARGDLVRLPAYLSGPRRRVREAIERRRKLGEPIEPADLAGETGLPLLRVVQVLRLPRRRPYHSEIQPSVC